MSGELKKASTGIKFIGSILALLIFGALILIWPRARQESLDDKRGKAREEKLAALQKEIAAWEKPVRDWLSLTSAGDQLIAEFLDLWARCRQDRETRAKAGNLDQACAGSQANLEAARKKLAEAEGNSRPPDISCGRSRSAPPVPTPADVSADDSGAVPLG